MEQDNFDAGDVIKLQLGEVNFKFQIYNFAFVEYNTCI